MRHLFLSLSILSTGCGAFYEDTTSTSAATYGHQIRTFDESLPNSMENLFVECVDVIVLEDGMTEIDPIGDCIPPDSTDTSWLADLIRTAQGTGETELAAPLSLSQVSEASTHEFKIWRDYGCSVDVTTIVSIDQVALYDLKANWTRRYGDPVMAIDFDFDEGLEAEISFQYSPVNCSVSGLNGYATRAIARVLGRTYTVTMDRPDLDIYLYFFKTPDGLRWSRSGQLMKLDVELVSAFRLNSIDTNTLFDRLPSDLREGILASAGFDPQEHEAQIDDGIEAALAPMAESIAAQMNLGLGAVCDIKVENGDLVLIANDDCVPDSLNYRLPPATTTGGRFGLPWRQ
jgi:hypothetical protein